MLRLNSFAVRTFALLILTAPAACDNVSWGGSDVQFIPPPPAEPPDVGPADEGFLGLGLPGGSVLFHAVRGEGGGRLIPVAEVAGDSLRPLRRPAGVSPEAYEQGFREAVIEPGAQFDLFRRGARVGSFIVSGPGPVDGCGVPSAQGSVVTVAAAADAGEFLAFRRGLAPEVMGEYGPPQIDGSIRTYASLLAERLILQNGLPRPRSWSGAQRDLQAVELSGGGNPEMAATYLVGDRLGVGAAERDGYSVFYLAAYGRRTGYTPLYSEVHDYRSGGKVAPRYVDHLDWNGDGGQEVLVQLFGANASWYESLTETDGNWRRLWEGPRCPAAATPPAE